MNFIDAILNRITMYRLVLYYLIALLVAAAVFGVFHIMPYSPISIAFSVGVLILSSYVSNVLFARVWRAVPGSASLYITALILALIVTPVAPTDISGAFFLVMLGVWASASKYLFAYNEKHIFNPAAFAVALAALVTTHGATWWVAGNFALFPILLAGGVLIVRKIQRLDLVLSFMIAACATVLVTSSGGWHAVWTTLIHTSYFFLAFVMLTEPATMPPTRSMRIAYGALVGIWFAPAMHVGSFYFTPELALLLGNLFTFIVSPKGRLMLTLQSKEQIAKDTHEFVFRANRPLPFRPGQYLEWTLPEGERTDRKGNRRYFTIASSPTEKEVRLAVRTTSPLSTFKQKLLALTPGDTITAAQLAGDFTLPKRTERKVAFIAGGIGITPFRSMVQAMMDEKDARSAVLLYSNKTAEEIAYYDLFEEAAEKTGLKTVYALTNDNRAFNGVHNGPIDPELIQREVPDFRERTFYISGPRSMVIAFKRTLRDLGLPAHRIKSDYFPGFA